MLEIEENFTSWTAENYSEISSTDAYNLTYVNISEILDENVKRNTTPNVFYTVMESLVAIVAVIGNGLVIIVFYRERRLRRRTNYYIISLALADLLVGLIGVPFAILASIGLPRNLHACLFTISTLVVLCTISIFCLVAVSIDRYWAILHPLAYSRNVRTKTAIGIISLCWVSGSLIGFLPLFGWHNDTNKDQCYFTDKMAYSYLVFLYFATIITPSIVLAVFYGLIYRVILKQVNKTTSSSIRVISTSSRSNTLTTGTLTPNTHSETQMLRLLNSAQKREVKATQNLSIIVLFFIICWIPLYTINCVNAFCHDCMVNPTVIYFAIILTHFNSAVNPLLYAYHLKDFRGALSRLFHCTSQPESAYRPSVTSQHLHKINDPFSRRNLEGRHYIDSPVWKRQQLQKKSSMEKNDMNEIIHAKSLVCDNECDSGLNISTYDLHAENDEKRATMSKQRSTLNPKSDDIFIISDTGIEMRSCFQQQKSSLYSIVQRKRESNEDSI